MSDRARPDPVDQPTEDAELIDGADHVVPYATAVEDESVLVFHCRVGDSVGRHSTAGDGVRYPLSRDRVGETGGVADEERATSPEGARSERDRKRERPLRRKTGESMVIKEVVQSCAQDIRDGPPVKDTDGTVVPLREEPTVPGGAGSKVEDGPLGNRASVGPPHADVHGPAHRPRRNTEQRAGPSQNTVGSDDPGRAPSLAPGLDDADVVAPGDPRRCPLDNSRSRLASSTSQVSIEFKAGRRHNTGTLSPPDQRNIVGENDLCSSWLCIDYGGGKRAERGKGAERETAGAGLRSWESSAFEKRDGEASLCGARSARGPRRSASDHDEIRIPSHATALAQPRSNRSRPKVFGS